MSQISLTISISWKIFSAGLLHGTTNSSVLGKWKKNIFLYQQETWSTPHSERFTNATTQLSTSKHIISLFRRTPSMNYSWAPISDAYCVWWQSLRLLAPGSSGILLQAQCSGHREASTVCSRVTRAVQAAPVASAVETAVCPQSVMAEMCGRLPPSAPHTHTPCHASCTHYHRRDAKAHDLGTKMSNAPQFRNSFGLSYIKLLDSRYSLRI